MPVPTTPHGIVVSKWTLPGTSAADTVLNLDKAAETGRAHYVTSIKVSFSDVDNRSFWALESPVGTALYHGYGDAEISLDAPIECPISQIVRLSVGAGGATITSKGVITGFTLSHRKLA
jgi:hypothetical protein